MYFVYILLKADHILHSSPRKFCTITPDACKCTTQFPISERYRHQNRMWLYNSDLISNHCQCHFMTCTIGPLPICLPHFECCCLLGDKSQIWATPENIQQNDTISPHFSSFTIASGTLPLNQMVLFVAFNRFI